MLTKIRDYRMQRKVRKWNRLLTKEKSKALAMGKGVRYHHKNLNRIISGHARHPKHKDVRELNDQKELSIKSQSEITKRQQELLDDLKHVYSWQHSHAWDLFYYLVDKNTQMFDEETINNFMSMSEDESLAVQIIFSQWVLSPDEVIENRMTNETRTGIK